MRFTGPGFFVVAILLLVSASQAQEQVAEFDTPGTHTFTVPAGVSEITVEVWGGGGRGGSVSGNGNKRAGGGGGGAYGQAVLAVTPGDSFNMIVGAGSASAAPGGFSSFGIPPLVVAPGGQSAGENDNAGAPGGIWAGVGDIGFNGGDGGPSGNIQGNGFGGGGGSSAVPGANGNSGALRFGADPPPPGDGGSGGDGGDQGLNEAGLPGTQPGGGGGGAATFFRGRNPAPPNPTPGGRGGDGLVRIRYPAPNHIRLLHDGSGITCAPEEITIQVCADAFCSALFPGPVIVNLTSPSGNWSTASLVVSESATVSLQVTSPGAVALNAASIPAAIDPTRCFIGGGTETCGMTWADSGFVINVPDHVSATSQLVTIEAVRTNAPDESCAPAFANTSRPVSFWSDYINPVTGTLPVAINGNPIIGSSPGSLQTVSFDASGVANVGLEYEDVGNLVLNARFEGQQDTQEEGLVLSGSDGFTARPAGFMLDINGNPGAGSADGPVFTTAAAAFQVNVQARNAAGNITPNFGREATPEGVQLVSGLLMPAGGNNPALAGDFGSFGQDCAGNAAARGTACGMFEWPEVGIIEITPRLASAPYIDSEDVVGAVVSPVGRFIPADFVVDAGMLTNRVALDGCSDDFTYIGELFGANWILTARNAAGATTRNYEGAFARLTADALGIAADEDITIDQSSIAWTDGEGAVSARISVNRDQPVGPFEDFQVGTAPADPDGVELAGLDIDLEGDDGIDDHGLVGTTELRFGRLVIDNAVGSELGPLMLPLRAEYFADRTWRVNTLDQCTEVSLVDDVELTGSNGDTGDGTATVGVGSGTTSIQDEDPVDVADGTTGFTFSAPGSPGWVDLELLLGPGWPFLRDDLDDDGNYLENPKARASFGLFEGDEGRIMIHEIPPR